MKEIPVDGVQTIDHTADIALEVRAPTSEELYRRAALGLAWVMTEGPVPEARGEWPVELQAADPSALLREWLRAVLHRFQDQGMLPAEVRVEEARGGRLRAVVLEGTPTGDAVREIKGVTLHDLVAEPRADGWYGRVIFDV